MTHNTNNDFYTFERERIGSGQGQAFLGYGFNFSRSGDRTYGNREMKVYLNARNPLESDGHKLSYADVERALRKIDEGESDTVVAEFAGNYLPFGSREYERAIGKVARDLVDNYDDLSIYGSISVAGSGAKADVIIGAFKELGFDSSIERDGEGRIRNAVVFDPNQIKSATENNGEFSRANPDIRFSFNGGEDNRTRYERMAEDALHSLNRVADKEVENVIVDSSKIKLPINRKASKSLSQNTQTSARTNNLDALSADKVTTESRDSQAFSENSAPHSLNNEARRAEYAEAVRGLVGEELRGVRESLEQSRETLRRAMMVGRGDPNLVPTALSREERRDLAKRIGELERRAASLESSLSHLDDDSEQRMLTRSFDGNALATQAEILLQLTEARMRKNEILRKVADEGGNIDDGNHASEKEQLSRFEAREKIALNRLDAISDTPPERPFEDMGEELARRLESFEGGSEEREHPRFEDFRHPHLDDPSVTLSERDRAYLEEQANRAYAAAAREVREHNERVRNERNNVFDKVFEELDQYNQEFGEWEARQRGYMREIAQSEARLHVGEQTDLWMSRDAESEKEALIHIGAATGVPLESSRDVQTYLRELRYQHARLLNTSEGEDFKKATEIRDKVRKAVGKKGYK